MIKQFKRFQDVASSPEGREVPHFPVMAKFFRALMAREESKDYPRLQVHTHTRSELAHAQEVSDVGVGACCSAALSLFTVVVIR